MGLLEGKTSQKMQMDHKWGDFNIVKIFNMMNLSLMER